MYNFSSDSKTLCPICDSYPLLYLTKDRPKDIFITCNNCGYNKCTSLHDYLFQIENNSHVERNNNKTYCNIHFKINNKYCINCKEYLCSQCNHHNSHKLIELDKIISTTYINNKVREGFNHINTYCNELSRKKINNYISKINQIEYLYQSLRSKSNDILNLIMLMINNYNNNHYNYYNRENINKFINTCSLYIYKCNNDNKYNTIISYYQNYTILIDSIVDSNNIYNIKTINRHRDAINSILLLSDGRLASCSKDNTIKIYNINNNYHCDITINTQYTQGVSDIYELHDNKLISYSINESMKIWSIFQSSYYCDYTFKNITNFNLCNIISLPNNRLAACSLYSIEIWNSKIPYNHIKTLSNISLLHSIIRLKDNKNIIISSHFDKTIHKWNLLTNQCETIFLDIDCNYNNRIKEIGNNRIIVGGQNAITIINILKNIIEYQIRDYKFKNICSFSILRDNSVLCVCDNGSIYIYDFKQNIIVSNNNKIHNKRVKCLIKINNTQFVTCSYDVIKVWKY